MENNNNGWQNALNPLSNGIKKFIHELIGTIRYGKNVNTIERFAATVQTKEDYENIAKLLVEIFESGYVKSVEQHKEALEKQGLKATIISTEQPKIENKIFNR